MAEVVGLEPTTNRLTVYCANQLRHTSKKMLGILYSWPVIFCLEFTLKNSLFRGSYEITDFIEMIDKLREKVFLLFDE